jgi:hypothetical protein
MRLEKHHAQGKMKKMLILLGLAMMSSGCSTPYMVDRRRDAADILTIGIGTGAGVKARIGPLHAGLLVNAPVVDLRGGALNEYRHDGRWSCDYEFLCVGVEVFYPDLSPGQTDQDSLIRRRHKEIRYGGDIRCVPTSLYTQVEVVGGLLSTFRLGINPGEFLDFILGWTTIDIFDDDLGTRTAIQKSSVPEDADRKLAEPSH